MSDWRFRPSLQACMEGVSVRRITPVLVGALVLGCLTAGPAAAATERVVVQAGSSTAAAAAVTRAGGRVLSVLPIVDGVVAEVPIGAPVDGVVTPDAALHPMSTDGLPAAPVSSVYREETGATGLPPATRAPVTVAVLDTGISKVGGLGAKLVQVPDPLTGQPADCANFSHETDCNDSYGHGTFLAGLIAGGGTFPGMAPQARLVSLKIAGRDGAADVSQVLAAIQYAVSFKDQLGIDVLNLSLGTDSNHDSRRDPLNRAVERAWRAGIVVVVAASNRGPAAGTISKPADDPLVITVGAVDDRGTPQRGDDTVPAFTGRGPVVQGPSGDQVTVYKPDVVAPGVGLVSLISPNSNIEQSAPPSTVGVPGYRRGSGTSQATAVVSGAVALLLERRDLNPDEVKAALWLGAHRVADSSYSQTGAGVIDVSGSLGRGVQGFRQPDPEQRDFDGLSLSRAATQVTGVGCGVLDARRSYDATCDHVVNEQTALGVDRLAGDMLLGFDGTDYAGSEWTGNSWYTSQWAQGNSWYGNSWYGNSWYSTDSGGQQTSLGSSLEGSAWYGVWK